MTIRNNPELMRPYEKNASGIHAEIVRKNKQTISGRLVNPENVPKRARFRMFGICPGSNLSGIFQNSEQSNFILDDQQEFTTSYTINQSLN